MKYAIPDEVLRHHTAVLGKTGSGKSSTSKLLIEQAVAGGARVCVLDTLKSDWWGITSSASGKSAGLPFQILGGPRGHVPLHSSAGKAIGQLVGNGKLPLSIVDMADFEPGGIQRFFVDFAQSLWKNLRGVVYLVVEEAHEIAPKERAGFGAENMAIHWAKKLATGSRTKGIKLIVATQRVQSLHNAVLGSCETLIAHRLTMDADQEPVLKWLKGANKVKASEVGESLASLPTGTGWICSGEAQIFERVAFPKFKTFDNTATPDVNAAEIEVETAQIDQAALRDLIGEEVKKAEADDPKLLRKRIAELEAAARKAPSADPGAIAEAEARGFERGVDAAGRAAAEAFRLHVTDYLDDMQKRIDERKRGVKELVFQRPVYPAGQVAAPAPKLAAPPRPAPTSVRMKPRLSAAVEGGDGSLSTALMKALNALAELASLGVHEPTREMVAAMADYANIQSRPIREAFARGLAEGLISAPAGGRVSITADGLRHTESKAAPLDAGEMRDRIAAAIGGAAGKVLTELSEVYPRAMSREEIAQRCGYANIQSRPIREAFSKLLDMGFITSPAAGQLVAGEALFPS